MQPSEHPVQEAEKKWRHWQSASPELATQLCLVAGFETELLRVWEGSDFVAQHCLKQPELLMRLQRSEVLAHSYSDGEMDRLLGARLAEVTDEPALHRELRCFRNEQMVRIIWRDLTQAAPLAETLEDLSALADACVSQALSLLYAWLTEKQGTPRNAVGEQQYLVVLGMGKLGARELNLSSDIDLIFAYRNRARLTVPAPHPMSSFLFASVSSWSRRSTARPWMVLCSGWMRGCVPLVMPGRLPCHLMPWRPITSPMPGSGNATP